MQFGGGAISGTKFAPFPSPLPPAGGGPVCSRLALLWDRSVLPLFCNQAGSVFRPVDFLSLSLATPQFKLLSHVSSLRLPSGLSGLVLTLSDAACFLSVPPPLAGGGCGRLGYFSAASCC